MLLDSDSATWDHGLDDIASDMDDLVSISSEYVEKNWKNTEFVKFVFFNAMQMSHAPQAAINKIKKNENEFWGLMHASDIAYAVTGLVNNEEKWKEKWDRVQEKKKALEEAQTQRGKAKQGGGRGGRGGGGKTKKRKNNNTVEEEDEEGDSAQVVKARWTMTTKQKYGDEGWSEDGRKFYGLMLDAVKGVNFNERGWQEVWKEFWAEERKVHFKRGEEKSRKKAATEEVDVGTLWDDDEMEAMGNNDSDNDDLKTFTITKMSAV